jgi:hypothetical protein
MEGLIAYVQSLAIGVLIGKIVLLSFIVAPILAKSLEREPFARVVRQLFPAYYALGMGAGFIGLVSVIILRIIGNTHALHHLAAGLWLMIIAAEAYCRSPLTPQSNAMRDRLKEQESQGAVDPALQSEWNRLHQRSVYLNSLVLLAGLCLLGVVRGW